MITSSLMIDSSFRSYSIDKLRQYEGRIMVCLDKLSDDQIWQRGADVQNAVGNLVLHLSGNLTEWILQSIAGDPPVRNRPAEFSARGSVSREELKTKLHDTLDRTVAVIENLPAERLAEMVAVQSYHLTILEAVYHVVEHFAYHAGQIVYATKLIKPEDLGFYRHLEKMEHSEKTP